jgi:3-hydroxyacyl-[acyl-carrier protein] dehydratase/trans-2-decenoyl-[acyl-carrier protein] isomerase
MTKQNAFTREDLLRCSRGELFGPGNAQLPAPNMLMVDRITHISEEGGKYGKGELVAELDITLTCGSSPATSKATGDAGLPGPRRHVAAGRLLPGLAGPAGPRPRAGFGRSEVLWPGLPTAKKVTYNIHIKRVLKGKLNMAIADGSVSVDGREIYTAEGLRSACSPPLTTSKGYSHAPRRYHWSGHRFVPGQ